MEKSTKQLVDVVIGGKIFKLAADESPEYIKRVADYIDNKLRELNVSASSNIMKEEHFAVILALNIADDLFKTKEGEAEKPAPVEPEQVRQLAELKNQLMTKINDYNLLLEQYHQKNSEVTGLKDTIYANEEAINNLNLKVEHFKTELDNSKKTVENKSRYIIDLTKKINDKNQELNNLSKKLAEKNSALNELNQKSAERNIKLNNVNKERDELAVRLKSANNTIRTLEKQAEEDKKNYENNIAELKSSHSNEITELKNKHKDEKDNLLGQIDTLEHDYIVLDEDSTALKKEFDKFKSDLENTTDGQLKAAFAKIKAENIELRRTIEELKTKSAKEKQ